MSETHAKPDMSDPKSFAFDEESERAIAAQVAKYPAGKQASAVLPALYIVQAQMRRTHGSGWVPRVAMDAVARRLKMPPMRVYEVATFYLMFNTTPIGRHHLQVCTTTPCWLRGSDAVLDACKAAAGVTLSGDTGADGMFTVTEVECLGACVNAPVVQVDDDFHEDLDAERTRALLERLRAGADIPPAGSSIGRQGSAPEGGPMTLVANENTPEPSDAR